MNTKRRLLRASEGAALFFLAALLRATTPPVAAPLEPAVFLAADKAGERVVVVGERGMIRLSDDRGTSWKSAPVPVNVTLTAVRFADPLTGWATGHEGVILKTNDGGASWKLVRGSPNDESPAPDDPADQSFFAERAPLFDLLALDPQRIWAVGAYGTALRSLDGGETWTPVTIGKNSDLHLFALVRDAGGALWAAGEAGVLYVSRDGGRSWSLSPKMSPGSFFGGTALDNGGVLLFGLRGRVFVRQPVDGAWKKLPGLTQRSLHGAVRVGKDTTLVGGAGGTLIFLNSRTGAADVRRLPVTRDIHCLLPLDADTVLIFSDGETRSYPLQQLREGAQP
ncbi:MAG: hypothetical protein IPN65_04025 [Elusimicrobia bacterium]|nr:hypothetical protein [Elusimicrobiota bacterium]MBK7545624.1 hypothetical protein [Elusimicrobiota bacterium]MBK7575186.1 hypothetical protein [Elusimicrobiota bacterium]MBK7687827.1 hypothetical protein [Elusimicrobiota bacterium]MBK8125254.1 hypothetical protein [Elusimicrobiota bacterium]